MEIDDYCFSYKLGGHYPEYNYSVDVEVSDEKELEFSGKGGYSVDWCDREGRHPWADINLEFSLKTQKYRIKMELGSKDGRIEESGIREGILKENMSADEVEELLSEEMDDLRYEVEEKA